MTQIKIGATKAEKLEAKERAKKINILSAEPVQGPNKAYISKRNEDLFIGGPPGLDGYCCHHAPNGPTLEWDPGRHWATYYILDVMKMSSVERPIKGYHVYSPTRALEMALLDEGALHRQEFSNRPRINLGTRGPLFRKCYYYAGFMEETLLILSGVQPSDFKEILTLS